MTLEYRFDRRGNVELQPTAQKRSYCWLYFLLFIILQAGGGAWLYFSGYLTPADSKDSVQALSLRGKMDEQERLLGKQAETMLSLESKVAMAQRSEAIQATANEALRDRLTLAESELAESQQRLLLYEEILSPQALDGGLNIQYLGIKRLLIDAKGKKLAHDRFYQYHLVLTNIRGDASLVEGRFNLKWQGSLAGKAATLDLSELDLNPIKQQGEPRYTFSLKYYQSLEGNIELPQGFMPEQVKVELRPASGKSGKKVTKQYGWDTFTLSTKSTSSKE